MSKRDDQVELGIKIEYSKSISKPFNNKPFAYA